MPELAVRHVKVLRGQLLLFFWSITPHLVGGRGFLLLEFAVTGWDVVRVIKVLVLAVAKYVWKRTLLLSIASAVLVQLTDQELVYLVPVEKCARVASRAEVNDVLTGELQLVVLLVVVERRKVVRSHKQQELAVDTGVVNFFLVGFVDFEALFKLTTGLSSFCLHLAVFVFEIKCVFELLRLNSDEDLTLLVVETDLNAVMRHWVRHLGHECIAGQVIFVVLHASSALVLLDCSLLSLDL